MVSYLPHPFTDVKYVYIRVVEHAASVCHLQLLSGACGEVYDAGSHHIQSLENHWHITPIPGIPIPASSSCYDRFGLPSLQGI